MQVYSTRTSSEDAVDFCSVSPSDSHFGAVPDEMTAPNSIDQYDRNAVISFKRPI